MAARRLIIVLVLLLAASVGAAAIAPDRGGRFLPTETTSTTTEPAPGAGPRGDALSVRITASAADPPTVEGFVGDQLTLTVDSDQPRTISIDPLGVSEFAGPGSPARFDLLLREAGALPITAADGEGGRGEVVGRLQVSKPGGGAAPGDGGSGQEAASERAAAPVATAWG